MLYSMSSTNYMTDAELDESRKLSRAGGLCMAEQLTERDRTILRTNIPWMCSLPADHSGEHEVHVDYVFTDGRVPQRNVKVHSWQD